MCKKINLGKHCPQETTRTYTITLTIIFIHNRIHSKVFFSLASFSQAFNLHSYPAWLPSTRCEARIGKSCLFLPFGAHLAILEEIDFELAWHEVNFDLNKNQFILH